MLKPWRNREKRKNPMDMIGPKETRANLCRYGHHEMCMLLYCPCMEESCRCMINRLGLPEND